MHSLSRLPPNLIARAGVGRIEKSEEICGELNPGFSLWTSAHGFHHASLSNKKSWRRLWMLLLITCCFCLLVCFIYYSYQTFSSAVYSRMYLKSIPTSWPTIYICSKSAFSRSKISLNGYSSRLVSYLTWTFSPSLAIPQTFNNSRLNMQGLQSEYLATVTRERFGGSLDLLLGSIILSCNELVLECKLGQGTKLTGDACCSTMLSSGPYLTSEGLCYSTRGNVLPLRGAGEGAGITIVTQHEELFFDNDITSPNLLSSQGLSLSVVDSNVSPVAAMKSAAFTINPNSYADIAINPTRIDDGQLSSSLIARESCHQPNDLVQSYLNTNQQEYGYSKYNCESGKTELIANKYLECSYIHLNDTAMPRCSPFHSSVFSDSVFGSGGSGRTTFSIDSSLNQQMNEECPKDCAYTRYSLSPRVSSLTNSLKESLQSKVAAGSGVNAVILRLYFSSSDYTVIENRPQPALQFVAEIGGIMAFFLGLSIITLIECCCYLGFWIKTKCCPGSNQQFMVGDERLRPPGPPRNSDLDFRERYNRRELGGSYP